MGRQTPYLIAPTALQGPYVQAGAEFTVHLDQAIDTASSPPGTQFTATVARPIVGEDGGVVVAAGAKVTGTVVSVGSPGAPLVRVQLDRIETVAGPLPLHAAVRSAEHSDLAGSSQVHVAEGRAMMQPQEILVPAGAAMKLVLVDPLILPGTRLLVH